MLATTTNWQDVKKYYLGTYIKLKELGDEVVYIDRVEPYCITGIIKNNDKITLELHELGYDLDYSMPRKTVYQEGLYAIVLERIPARQWKKGLNKENTSIQLVDDDGTKITKNIHNFEAIFSFVNKPEYKKLSDLNVCKSVALSPRFYACLNGLIYCDEHVIGKVVEKTIHFHKIFQSNMEHLFFGQGYELIAV